MSLELSPLQGKYYCKVKTRCFLYGIIPITGEVLSYTDASGKMKPELSPLQGKYLKTLLSLVIWVELSPLQGKYLYASIHVDEGSRIIPITGEVPRYFGTRFCVL